MNKHVAAMLTMLIIPSAFCTNTFNRQQNYRY